MIVVRAILGREYLSRLRGSLWREKARSIRSGIFPPSAVRMVCRVPSWKDTGYARCLPSAVPLPLQGMRRPPLRGVPGGEVPAERNLTPKPALGSRLCEPPLDPLAERLEPQLAPLPRIVLRPLDYRGIQARPLYRPRHSQTPICVVAQVEGADLGEPQRLAGGHQKRSTPRPGDHLQDRGLLFQGDGVRDVARHLDGWELRGRIEHLVIDQKVEERPERVADVLLGGPADRLLGSFAHLGAEPFVPLPDVLPTKLLDAFAVEIREEPPG